MKILVTGGAGFIGSHLSEALLGAGNEVWVIDDLSTGRVENIQHLEPEDGFTFVIDTITNETLLEEAVKWSDQVYHLAAAVGVRLIVEEPINPAPPVTKIFTPSPPKEPFAFDERSDRRAVPGTAHRYQTPAAQS